MTLVMTRTRQPARDEARRRILDAAIGCFARAGFHGTSMQQICTAAEMSPGGLYRYFPSKDAIIEAIAELEREHNSELMADLETEGPVLEALFQTGFAYMRQVAGTARAALCAEINAEAHRNSKVREIFERIDKDVRAALRATLERAREKGEIDAALDLDLAVLVLMSIGEGLTQRMTFEPTMTTERIDPFLRDIVTRMLRPRDAGDRTRKVQSL